MMGKRMERRTTDNTHTIKEGRRVTPSVIKVSEPVGYVRKKKEQ